MDDYSSYVRKRCEGTREAATLKVRSSSLVKQEILLIISGHRLHEKKTDLWQNYKVYQQ